MSSDIEFKYEIINKIRKLLGTGFEIDINGSPGENKTIELIFNDSNSIFLDFENLGKLIIILYDIGVESNMNI